ncbi:MAG TPA: dihydrofolate reductase family protein, partial [Acidimicrobiales bacterium]|nr:dihydrofolate reductase family protein [Acidimicrobiales bacterium]
SLDGVINHMERWHFDFIDEESDALALAQLRASDALLMGRRTYELYAQAWPGRDGEYADLINATTKYVASTTVRTGNWAPTTILGGDLIDEIATLKRESGQRILMHGYGPVAKALVDHGLLDQLVLWVHPVLAGVGTTDDMLFSEGLNERLSLADVQRFASGVVVLSYRLDRAHR